MGEQARWTDVEEIKQRLLEPVAERLGEELGRSAKLVIEKDKTDPGPIHPSMFGEAVDSEVYIADLSGANANVYLELGVRWALRDNVTVLISQDINDDLKFNTSGNRVITYGPMPNQLSDAVNRIVESALVGLRNKTLIDSPVRRGMSLYAAPRSDWDDLRAQIERLREAQGDDLIAAANRAPNSIQAIALLRNATERNPVSIQAHFQLGVALRKAGDYAAAIEELRTVVGLKEDFAEGWRELGVSYNKNKQLSEAAEAFRRSVELDDSHAETWSNLGGLRRRQARAAGAPSSFDWELLRESRDSYHHASQLLGNDTYSLVNEARLDLLLCAIEPENRAVVLSRLRKLENLARFEAYPDEPEHRDPWKGFDLADTLLLTGRVDDGIAELRSAIELIDPLDRKSYLTSVMDPLQDFLVANVVDEPTADGIRMAIDVCRQIIGEVPA
jgi:tetratricopeptide (TPR) repeat protein